MSNHRSLPLAPPPRLGVLSIHLDGAPCHVGCQFCYLGARTSDPASPGATHLDGALIEDLLARLDYDEVAVAVSEPARAWLDPLRTIVHAAHRRGRPVAVTTTVAALAEAPELVDGVARINLSVDPRKGSVSPTDIGRAAHAARSPGREIVLITTLVAQGFAEAVIDGLLARYLALESVDKVALSALKPPPPWCGRDFWLRTCARLGPLLAQHLDRRLFLDCWVAARVLGLGPCPARPDLSPGPSFRSCVYQPAPDCHFSTGGELVERLRDFVAPAQCPFEIPA